MLVYKDECYKAIYGFVEALANRNYHRVLAMYIELATAIVDIRGSISEAIAAILEKIQIAELQAIRVMADYIDATVSESQMIEYVDLAIDHSEKLIRDKLLNEYIHKRYKDSEGCNKDMEVELS